MRKIWTPPAWGATKPPRGWPLNRDHDLSRNMVLAATFQDGVGQNYIADSSGRGNTGVLTNCAAGGVGNWTQGNGGWKFDFDGVNDWITCGNAANLNFGTGPFTVGVQFTIDAFETRTNLHTPVVWKMQTDGAASAKLGWAVRVRNVAGGNIVDIILSDASALVVVAGPPVVIGRRCTVFMTRGAVIPGKFRLYVDGELYGEDANGRNGSVDNSWDVGIGHDHRNFGITGNYQYMDGSVE